VYLPPDLNFVRTFYKIFFVILERKAPDRRCSKFLLRFRKIIITTIVCLAPVIDSSTSPTARVRCYAGRGLGGALGWRISVNQESRSPRACYFPTHRVPIGLTSTKPTVFCNARTESVCDLHSFQFSKFPSFLRNSWLVRWQELSFVSRNPYTYNVLSQTFF
jgi:hypothetical protein